MLFTSIKCLRLLRPYLLPLEDPGNNRMRGKNVQRATNMTQICELAIHHHLFIYIFGEEIGGHSC